MFRYILELITGLPTNGICGPVNPNDPLQKPLIHPQDREVFVAHKRHDFKNVTKEDFVFFIIRDYIDAIIRHNEAPRGLATEKLTRYIDSYMDLLRQFDAHPGNKIALYYEQLLKISSKASLDIYPRPATRNRQPATRNRQPATGNRQPATGFHKSKLTPGQLQLMQRHVVQNYSDLYTRYLTRYKMILT